MILPKFAALRGRCCKLSQCFLFRYKRCH